jgi:PAS domain S-box-containing protein
MKNSLKIVHLEGSATGKIALDKALREAELDTEIRVASSREEYVTALTDFSPDLILSEFTLPDIHCSEALAILGRRGMKIPFIVFSSTFLDEMAGELLAIGADDYVVKDRPGRLPFAIARCLEKYRAEKKQLNLLEDVTNIKEQFRILTENSTEPFVILNASAHTTYASPAVETVLGYRPEDMLGVDIFTRMHPDDLAEFSRILVKVAAGRDLPTCEYTGRMLHQDGSWRWIEATLKNLLHEPSVKGIVQYFRDVTEKKACDVKILQLEKFHAFLRQVNHTLVHAPDEKTVFSEVCRIACETVDLSAAWIGMPYTGNDQSDTVQACGISGEKLAMFLNADAALKALDKILQSEPYYVSNNMKREFPSVHWKSLAASAGIESCMVLPVKRSGTLAGSFHLYASEPDFFTQDKITLLQDTALAISFALDVFEKGRQKLITDRQLSHKEMRLSQAQAIAHLGSWETYLETNTSVWSDETCRIFGLPETDNIQTRESWTSFIHPEDVAYVLQTNKQAIDSGRGADYYYRILRKDGQIRYLHAQAQVELSGQGQPVSLYGVLHDVTRMTESQKALRSSESNLRAIFENTSEGFILTDIQGRVKYFNGKARYFFRLNTGRQIKLGDKLFDAASDNYETAIAAVLSGKTWQYENVYQRVDGKEKWLSTKVNLVYEKHRATGFSLTIMDITDRKLAQDQLQRSESNLNAIMNNTDALIYSLDTDLRYITYNDALKTLMKERYGVEVHPGFDIRKSMEKFDPGSAAEWQQINNRAFNGEILKFEKVLPHAGSPSHLKFSIHPIRKNNTITGLSCFVNDITREKQAEEAVLKALEERNIILESIGDAFYAVDRHWAVTYWNKKAETMFNCPKERILGKKVWDVFPYIVGSSFHKSYQKALEQNTIQHFESYSEWDNAWLEVTAYPSPSGLSIYLKDITERKRSESELYELNKNLQKYTDELIASNKGLEQFSYIVSHNLRAPVANIIGLSKLTEEDIYPPEVKAEFLSGIFLNVKRLDDVVSDLNAILQFKRDVSEKRERVSLQELIGLIRSSIQDIIDKEQVEIQTDFSAVTELFTLRSYLHSIFYNLILNSIKYRQTDIPPAIMIKSDITQGGVTISVKDNGLGIDLGKKGKQLFGLYKRFHQHVEGKGMGLFMVKTQVEMLGGKITATSAVNKGTEFRIEFSSDAYQMPV